jgi:hypothetical protein
MGQLYGIIGQLKRERPRRKILEFGHPIHHSAVPEISVKKTV